MVTAEMLQTQSAFIIVSAEDLREFATLLLKAQTQPQPPKTPEPEKPISQTEAVHFLGRSRQTLVKWRKKGAIKSYRIGGRIYYKRSELLEALKRNE